MPVIKAVVALPYFTGLPEDLAQNTLYFAPVATPTELQLLDLANRVEAAYLAVDALLSPVINGNNCSVTFYDMSDPEPRQPLFSDQIGPLTVGSSGLPEEVAAVFSFRAAYASGQPNARRRGRVYLGPMAQASLTSADSDSFAGWNGTAWSGVLTNFVAGLVGDPGGANYGGPWVVYSRTDNIGRNVIEAWRDNVPDTQRRRGPAPTSRSTLVVNQE